MLRRRASGGLLWIAACASAGCGPGGALPRAHAPEVPDAESRCRAAAASESPLVTEWSAAEKASLQARLQSGALAVEFSGCTMRPLPACVLRGSYRWQRTTPAVDAIEITDQDQLYAKLPLGAVALEGELSRAGRLSIRTAVSGQYLLDGSTPADVPDYGECAAATHLLTGVALGAFQLHSGGTLQAGASASAGQLGGGAQTKSSETLLRQAGDFDSCKLATDAAPELSCGSPIQVFLSPLPRFTRERGSGTIRAAFVAGSADTAWELRANQQFVCRTPCTRWINPSETYELRTEGGPAMQTLDVPSLAPYAGASHLEVRAHPRNQSALLGGIVAAGVGGGLAFMGGFLALAGGLGHRDGLLVAGGVTAGIGLVAIGPGVYLIATSGARTEIRDGGVPIETAKARGVAPGLGVSYTF